MYAARAKASAHQSKAQSVAFRFLWQEHVRQNCAVRGVRGEI